MTPSPGDAIGAGAVVPLTAPALRPMGPPARPTPGRPESGPSWSADGIEEVPTTAGGAVPAELTDRFGRSVKDLRLSVTDRCNLHCTYYMGRPKRRDGDRGDAAPHDRANGQEIFQAK